MAALPLLLSAYLSKPANVIYVSKVYYYDKNLTLTQNMPGNLRFSELDFLSSTGLMTVYNNLINYINLINPTDIPAYSPLSSLQFGDYFINPDANNFQSTQIIQEASSSNINNSKIINFVATVDTSDLNFGTIKPDYTNVLTNINNNLSALVSKDNQSQITEKLKDIFQLTLSSSRVISVFKANIDGNYNDNYKVGVCIPSLLKRFANLFYYENVDYNSNYSPDSKPMPRLYNLNQTLTGINSKLSETVSNVDVPLLKEIALAISSLASASDNQAIKALKDTISALELKVNVDNTLLVDGTQEFKMRPFGKNYIDDEDESYS